MVLLWTFCWVLFAALNGYHLFINLVALLKGLLLCRRRARGRKNIITRNGHEDLETWPFVSILKPVVQDNAKVKSLLEMYFQLDYPKYELHFCFQTLNNSCIPFVHQLSQKYPAIKVIVHTEPAKGRGNKKILNMVEAFEASTGELIWITDENIAAPVSLLKEVITQFDDREVACIHLIPVWKCKGTFQDALSTNFFFGTHSKYYFVSELLNIPCVSGMSMMYDKKKLLEIGGLRPFERFLSEDYMLITAFTSRGYITKVAPSPAIQDPHSITTNAYVQRMIRWTKLRFNIIPVGTLLEPFSQPLVLSVISSVILFLLVSLPLIPVFLCYLVVSFLSDSLFSSILNEAFSDVGPHPSLYRCLVAWLSNQFFFYPYIWIKAASNFRKIEWHNSSYNITWNTVIQLEDDDLKNDRILSRRYRCFKELQNKI